MKRNRFLFKLKRIYLKFQRDQQRNNKNLVFFANLFLLYVFRFLCCSTEKITSTSSEYNDEIGKCVRLKPKSHIKFALEATDTSAHVHSFSSSLFLYKNWFFSRKGFFSPLCSYFFMFMFLFYTHETWRDFFLSNLILYIYFIMFVRLCA